MTISIYICGPTVYEKSHCGHSRTYTMIDLMIRTMENIFDQKLLVVMNITDIDDKIINKSLEQQQSWTDISKYYEKSFFASLGNLNIKPPHIIIRVSEVIPQIVSYIQTIIDKGFAYVVQDGSVYFDTMYYEKMGYRLDHPTEEIPDENSLKKNRRDFALWKGRASEEIGFDAEFIYQGKKLEAFGRPGWHLECSCMINKTIGDHLDIHFGGIDLKFPHHHNEILQSNAFHHPIYQNPSKMWCDRFVHIGHLNIKGQKMSKSLKNFTTIDEALQTIGINQMRWIFMANKWSEPMELDSEVISQAKSYDNIISNFFGTVENYPFDLIDIKMNEKEIFLEKEFSELQKLILEHLKNFNFHFAHKAIFELISKTHTYLGKEKQNKKLVLEIQRWIYKLLTDLGFDYRNNSYGKDKEIMQALINTRTRFRNLTRDKTISKETKQKIFEILDAERDVLLPEIGITLKDTKDSSMWNN